MGLGKRYWEELRNCAVELYSVKPETQATLRRAVSTAYYSLLHFLIEKTVRRWAIAEQREKLARVFEHRVMLDASKLRVKDHTKALPGSNELQLKYEEIGAALAGSSICFLDRSVTWNSAGVRGFQPGRTRAADEVLEQFGRPVWELHTVRHRFVDVRRPYLAATMLVKA